ncbi:MULTISPECIES: mycofactocin system FadH/OYE family oxidoreductase 1 [Protofrankia]|uniref:2,4-dienoyl-CoA reductase (NADPH) n=1 Tax=Candidatus Protofrankia datiscae TaxID=2716812 RepID=F8B3Z9_9ACTN|nr:MULTISPECIES: mycofactocin system FadH/OYE family oxidoreductase 1 [Protofrankia]AEH10011.1 2,4-dienoyl-CoA reductase (NADPH) [Candidatus Protofrankia datiscae]
MPAPQLADPLLLGARQAPSRVLFGPHETNLGHRRSLSPRQVAYYARRAAGGAGIIVTETASVTADDWPYERAPLAADCAPGWSAVADACREHGTLVLAGLGHAGGQGSSAFSQSVLWAPSPVADAASRELPAEMEQPEIDAVIEGFAAAARLATAAGTDGVEIDAGAVSLLRQFHSGLTNQRQDDYGSDRLRLTREVIAAVRGALGAEGILALRLSCDELAPWAGVTPEQAAAQVAALAGDIDLLVVVRGGPFSTSAYRPTAHTPPMFNLELCRRMRAAAGGVPMVLQGSVVDVAEAEAALADGVADMVEMTRAQIAEPDLVRLARAGAADQVRPCVLCNQACRVRDNRNPVVSCVGEPYSGHETAERPVAGTDPRARGVLVVGGGPAGLEAARVLVLRGHQVRLAERTGALGGALRAAAVGPGRTRLALLTDWLAAQCHRLRVRVDLGVEVTVDDLDAAVADGWDVLLATGSRPVPGRYGPAGADDAAALTAGSSAAAGGEGGAADDSGNKSSDAGNKSGPGAEDRADSEAVAGAGVVAGAGADDEAGGAAEGGAAEDRPGAGGTTVLDVLDVLRGGLDAVPAGPVFVHDPVGGPVAVGVAEWLAGAGREVTLGTPDTVAGTLLSLTGDLAPANTRLQQAGVRRQPRVLLREAGGGRVVLEDVWTGERRTLPCAVLVDCGHRLPEEALYTARPGTPRAGDCVAPRTVLEAVLEGRRRALGIGGRTSPPASRPLAGARRG